MEEFEVRRGGTSLCISIQLLLLLLFVTLVYYNTYTYPSYKNYYWAVVNKTGLVHFQLTVQYIPVLQILKEEELFP